MNKMKTINFLITLIFMGILTACVQFKEAQPQQVDNLNSFPSELIGKYTDPDQGTLTITEKSMNYVSKDQSKKMDKTLGNECILRSFNGYFVFNIKEDPNWQVFLTKAKGKDLDVFTLKIADNDKKLKKLQKIVKVEINPAQEGGNTYVINPSKDEFQLLIDKQFFSKTNLFKRVN
jgi:hypothetical protein